MSVSEAEAELVAEPETEISALTTLPWPVSESLPQPGAEQEIESELGAQQQTERETEISALKTWPCFEFAFGAETESESESVFESVSGEQTLAAWTRTVGIEIGTLTLSFQISFLEELRPELPGHSPEPEPGPGGLGTRRSYATGDIRSQ